MMRKATTRKKPANVLSVSTRQFLGDDLPTGPPQKKLKPLSSAPKLHVFSIDNPTQTASQRKGKEKAVLHIPVDSPTLVDDKLWLEMYEPMDETDLAVHKRKVEDVRRWLTEAFEGGPSGKLRKYRRLLVLSGPAGSAKTTTMRVLSKELGFEILEWQNGVSEGLPLDEDPDTYGQHFAYFEGAMDKFQAFVTRAASCRTIFSPGASTSSPTGASLSQTSQLSLATQRSNGSQAPSDQRGIPSKAQVILLEDLPNIAHGKTQERFYDIVEGLVQSEALIPVVIIVSDAGIRGETGDDVAFASGPSRRETIGIRSVIPPDLWRSPYVTEIKFNPISATLMKKALQLLVTKHFSKSLATARPTKDSIDLVVESSNGDIRSAIMALQFASIANTGKTDGKARKKGSSAVPRALIEDVSKREQSMAMFHLLGKIMYNKRKGDPLAPAASAKGIQRDKDLDATLKDAPPLPAHLKEHERRASRVDVEVLYADSPIDASLLSLYVHQNYTQFCNELEEADGVSEWLSWIDSNGGEQWYQTNPNSFHLVSLGTLHSLPSPVPRRSQQMYKPEFFENLKQCRDSQDAVEDVMQWLSGIAQMDPGIAGGTQWKKSEIAMELGPILRAKTNLHNSGPYIPPPSHRLFSALVFSQAAQGSKAQISEDEVPLKSGMSFDEVEGLGRQMSPPIPTDMHVGGWLEDDDIED